MQGQHFITKTLDLLVDMSEHCLSMKSSGGKSKCAKCALHWSFNIANHGCFLVETIENNEKFIDDLQSVSNYQKLEYKSKLKKIADIFVTECE